MFDVLKSPKLLELFCLSPGLAHVFGFQLNLSNIPKFLGQAELGRRPEYFTGLYHSVS